MSENEIKCLASDLRSAVNAVSPLVKGWVIAPVMKSLKFTPSGGSMSVEAGGEFQIGFDPRYLRQITDIFDTIRIEASDPTGPARILTEDPALTIVLMPMSVR